MSAIQHQQLLAGSVLIWDTWDYDPSINKLWHLRARWSKWQSLVSLDFHIHSIWDFPPHKLIWPLVLVMQITEISSPIWLTINSCRLVSTILLLPLLENLSLSKLYYTEEPSDWMRLREHVSLKNIDVMFSKCYSELFAIVAKMPQMRSLSIEQFCDDQQVWDISSFPLPMLRLSLEFCWDCLPSSIIQSTASTAYNSLNTGSRMGVKLCINVAVMCIAAVFKMFYLSVSCWSNQKRCTWAEAHTQTRCV